MKLSNDNLKKAGYFNSVLIVAAIILRAINFANSPTLMMVDNVVCILALVFGLLYSLNGYKKEAAKYYKTFMYLYALSSLISFAAPLISFGIGNYNLENVINFAVFVCACLLAFVKDFGKNNSNTTVCIALVLTGIKLVNDLLNGTLVNLHFASFSIFVQAMIACVLVSHKYIDKESRGAK